MRSRERERAPQSGIAQACAAPLPLFRRPTGAVPRRVRSPVGSAAHGMPRRASGRVPLGLYPPAMRLPHNFAASPKGPAATSLAQNNAPVLPASAENQWRRYQPLVCSSRLVALRFSRVTIGGVLTCRGAERGRWIMRRPKLAALWRYRPRALTLALLLVIATLIALANLVSEVGPYLGAERGTAGWPLVWHWHHF